MRYNKNQWDLLLTTINGGAIVATADMPRLLTVKQAAEFLGWTPDYLRRLARARRIPAVKLGQREWRFYLSSLQEWLAQGCPAQEEQPALFDR